MISQVLSAIELSPLTLVFCLIFVILGGYLKGFAGFGASMFWMTSLSLVIPPLQLVPMVLMFEVASSIYLLPGIWKKIDWRSIGFLLAGTWIATPAGIYALITLPAAPVRIALALVVLLAAIMLLRGFSLEKVPGKTATVGVGMAAGVLNGSMGIVGPPVVLFYFSSPVGMTIGRASVITYLIGTDTVGTVMFAAQDLIDPSIYWRTALFLPLLFLGSSIGSKGFIKTDPDKFRKLSLYVLLILSVILMVRALLGD